MLLQRVVVCLYSVENVMSASHCQGFSRCWTPLTISSFTTETLPGLHILSFSATNFSLRGVVPQVRNAQHMGAAGVIVADNVCLCNDEACRSETKIPTSPICDRYGTYALSWFVCAVLVIFWHCVYVLLLVVPYMIFLICCSAYGIF